MPKLPPKPWAHLYKAARWKRLRVTQLSLKPCCEYCERQGRIEIAEVVDHIKPHKGDELLFFDADNLQSLCKQHHDSTKAREEAAGLIQIGGDVKGTPLDPNHHWNT